MNMLFNGGYIALDLKWFVEVTTAEPNYWFRFGFVGGDILHRFFDRNYYDAPTR